MSPRISGSGLQGLARIVIVMAAAALAACGGGGTGAGTPLAAPADTVLKALPLHGAGLAALAPDVVDTTTAGDQHVRTIGALFDGGYTVVWLSGPGVFMQRYDASGAKAGARAQLPFDLVAHPDPSIAVLGDGSAVVAYATETLDAVDASHLIATSTIQSVHFDAQGSTASTRTVASFSENRVGARVEQRVAAPVLLPLDDGTYLNAWSFVETGVTGTVTRFRLQQFDAQDAPVGDAKAFETGLPDQRASYRLLAAPGGEYAIEIRKSIQGQEYVVFLLRSGAQVGSFFDPAQFLPAGTTFVPLAGGQFRLVPPPGGTAIALADGGYVIIDGQLAAQRFDSTGMPLGAPLPLDTGGPIPLVTPLADEGFAFAWDAPGAGGDIDVFTQRVTEVDGPGNSRQVQLSACRGRATALSGMEHRTFMRDCIGR